jgi:Na+-translocating ferredoxin:NAD+ oxidoreductase subunit B
MMDQLPALLNPILALLGLALVLGAFLGFAAIYFKVDADPVVERINALLPQTQCGQCGYPGCKPYAQAIANEGETINKCPPGGENTILKLANLLSIDPIPLDSEYGTEKESLVAFIREAECIACTKCILACPVDAILGAAKQMHTVITAECTGCDLCIEPCPVDCIEMIPAKDMIKVAKQPQQVQLSQLQTMSLNPACIRCDFCTEECPVGLLPQQLYWFARSREHDKAIAHNLFDCIECGACVEVCPSKIPLVEYYRSAKSEINLAKQERRRAEHSKYRFEFRQLRTGKESLSTEQRRFERSELARKNRLRVAEYPIHGEDQIQIALQRVKAKQAAKSKRLLH